MNTSTKTNPTTKKARGHSLALRQCRSRATRSIENQAKAEASKKTNGHIPVEKPTDCFRLMFENWNGLGIFANNKKIDRINNLLRKYDVDCVAGCETRADWRFVSEEGSRFHNLFLPEKRSRGVAAHNTTERTNRDQWGGTAITTMGRLTTHVINTGSDNSGLGRWAWVLLSSREKRTRIVVAYQPCTPARSSKGGTVFEQHQRHFQQCGDFRSPRSIFYDDLTSQLASWRRNKEEIILCGDFNENVYTGRLAKRLGQDDILMKEQCLLTNKVKLPATFVTGSRPIDAVFATRGVETINASILQKYGGVGDHRCFLLDFSSESVLGGYSRGLSHRRRGYSTAAQEG